MDCNDKNNALSNANSPDLVSLGDKDSLRSAPRKAEDEMYF